MAGHHLSIHCFFSWVSWKACGQKWEHRELWWLDVIGKEGHCLWVKKKMYKVYLEVVGDWNFPGQHVVESPSLETQLNKAPWYLITSWKTKLIPISQLFSFTLGWMQIGQLPVWVRFTGMLEYLSVHSLLGCQWWVCYMSNVKIR